MMCGGSLAPQLSCKRVLGRNHPDVTWVMPEDEQLGDYARGRYELHVALVDAIADHDLRALDLLQEHNIGGPMVGEAAGSV